MSTPTLTVLETPVLLHKIDSVPSKVPLAEVEMMVSEGVSFIQLLYVRLYSRFYTLPS